MSDDLHLDMLNFIPCCLRTQAILGLDSKSLGKIIQSYAQRKELKRGKEIHGLLLRLRYPICTRITNHLIAAYFRCGVLRYAHNLFDKMPHRNLVSWTSMITGFSQSLRLGEATKTFSQMRFSGLSPTEFATASLIRACVSLGSTRLGVQIHCLALKCGLAWNAYVASNLSDMYSRVGSVSEARKLFEEIEFRDVVLWTTVIDGFAKNGEFESALRVFNTMIGEGFWVDAHVLNIVFKACASMKSREFGNCLHSSVVKLGFELELSVTEALVEMYSDSGDIENASNVFKIFSDPRKAVLFS